MIPASMLHNKEPESERSSLSHTAIIGALFFLSGFTTLVYEISWTRQIGNVVGNTVTASSIVLASIFVGVAIGSYIAAARLRAVQPMILFSGCEFFAAVWALSVPWALASFESMVAWNSNWPVGTESVIQVILVSSVLLPATIPLGATLPAIDRALRRDRVRSRSSSLPTLYGLNTMGAMAGGIICSYGMIMSFGVSGSSRVAACLGILVAVVSAVYGMTTQELEQINVLEQNVPQSALLNHARQEDLNRSWWVAGVSGFVILAFEVLYTRLFSLVFHNSIYTFGNIVTAFLLSLAIGSWLSVLLQRRWNPEKLIPYAAVFAAIAVMVSLWFFVRISRLDYFVVNGSVSSHLLQSFLLVVGVVVVPVTLMGLLLPLSWQLNGSRQLNNHDIGRLVAVNSVAAAFGAIMAGIFFLPLLGLWASFLLLAGILILLSSLFSQQHTAYIGAAASLFIMTAVSVDSYSWQNLGLGKNEVLITRRESAFGWIDVTRDLNGTNWYLRENLHYRHGVTGEQATRQKRQARLPLLLHSHPEKVLFLGLGTGMTAAGALPFQDVMSLEVVELIPDVVEAAKELGDSSGSIFKDKRTTVKVDDARHFLNTSSKNYDVIVADLYVPWESKTGYLYSQEHFLSVADRLNSDGMFCQWLPLYQLGKGEFLSICDTFASVFPHTSLWWGKMDASQPIIALVGMKGPIQLNEMRLTTLFEKLNVKETFHDQELSNFEHLQLSCLGVWKQQGSLLNTDEFPRVEFNTPNSLMAKQLLKGRNFQAFYDKVLSTLQAPSILSDKKEFISPESFNSLRETQSFLILGGKHYN